MVDDAAQELAELTLDGDGHAGIGPTLVPSGLLVRRTDGFVDLGLEGLAGSHSGASYQRGSASGPRTPRT